MKPLPTCLLVLVIALLVITAATYTLPAEAADRFPHDQHHDTGRYQAANTIVIDTATGQIVWARSSQGWHSARTRPVSQRNDTGRRPYGQTGSTSSTSGTKRLGEIEIESESLK